MSDLNCPECGTPVSAPGVSHATGHGTGRGEIAWQPSHQYATCTGCGTKLMRNPDLGQHGLDRWRRLDR